MNNTAKCKICHIELAILTRKYPFNDLIHGSLGLSYVLVITLIISAIFIFKGCVVSKRGCNQRNRGK